MPFFRSGEQVKAGDRVRLHGEPGEIESVHDAVQDPDDWFIKMCGAGAMIAEPKGFGRLFIDAPVL